MRKNLAMLEGWRFEQFGRDALELVEGKLAFAVVRGKLRMTHIDDMHDAMRESDPPGSGCDEDDDMPRFEEEGESELE